MHKFKKLWTFKVYIRGLIVDEKTYIIWIQNVSIIDIVVIRDSNLIK
jgi:hypothetical protein